MRVLIESVGVIGPGLMGWEQGVQVLRSLASYAPTEVQLTPVDALPAAERRRTGPPVRLALSVGLQALANSRRSATEVMTVFTSSGGDGLVIHEICESLATAQREVSPTRFHNSVHNAPAGYWGIATRSHAASTSLCAFDWSFAAGLIEASTQTANGSPVLLISYDLPYPAPLHEVRPVNGVLGIALLLSARGDGGGIAALTLEVGGDSQDATRMQNDDLEALRANNPTGRGLPLLQALATGEAQEIALDYLNGSLMLRTAPV